LEVMKLIKVFGEEHRELRGNALPFNPLLPPR
jgi:hypothetical protein